MGRHFEVRAASMAKTAAVKAKLYSRYGKEILMAAKSGVPDPDMNASLKKVIERAKANQVPADVIKRAIEKPRVERMKTILRLHMKALVPVVRLRSSLTV